MWRRCRAALIALVLVCSFVRFADAADAAAVAQFPLTSQGEILAEELSRHWTRDARRLVSVLEEAVQEDPNSPSLTFLLAVAHAETNGKILIVSEAGAVGLAQATPSAYLREGGRGKLFVTPEYLAGSLAYILKKPLGDADTIATLVIDNYEDETVLADARTLLHAAFKFRREGIDELRLLEAYGGAEFAGELQEREASNRATLDELERLLAGCASPAELIAFRDRVRDQYELLKNAQRFFWKRYQGDLVRARDAVLRRFFENDPKIILNRYAYEAADIIARELDDRFSPRSMARFLRDHVVTKRDQAYELGIAQEELERVTAGLYNGGSHNLLRMRSGLIRNLPETNNYMRKVPAMRARLDEALSSTSPPGHGDAGTR